MFKYSLKNEGKLDTMHYEMIALEGTVEREIERGKRTGCKQLKLVDEIKRILKYKVRGMKQKQLEIRQWYQETVNQQRTNLLNE